MKYNIVESSRFKKSFKKVSQYKNFRKEVFFTILENISQSVPLDQKYRDHKLHGEMKEYRECHISPDILLIYKINNETETVTLHSIGSHSNLFN